VSNRIRWDQPLTASPLALGRIVALQRQQRSTGRDRKPPTAADPPVEREGWLARLAAGQGARCRNRDSSRSPAARGNHSRCSMNTEHRQGESGQRGHGRDHHVSTFSRGVQHRCGQPLSSLQPESRLNTLAATERCEGCGRWGMIRAPEGVGRPSCTIQQLQRDSSHPGKGIQGLVATTRANHRAAAGEAHPRSG